MREKLIDIVEAYADFLDWDTKEEMVDSIMEFLAKDNNVPSKWIPVTERKPTQEDADKYGRVLAIEIGMITLVNYRGPINYPDRFPHWMPLPEPPNACHMTSKQTQKGE